MSKKLEDRHGRWRNVTVAFRISPEEADELNSLVELSGLTKQDYITSKLLNRNFEVIPNSRVQKALRTKMEAILTELSRLNEGTTLSPELQETISSLSAIFIGLGNESPKSKTLVDPLIEMNRGAQNAVEGGVSYEL